MNAVPRPVVYAGPSIGREDIRKQLPAAVIRDSIRRGDLYRDRALGYSVFLIIDGVFFQDEAVSPREVLDVIADGAVVYGASSMGALRAAECWPAGMRGVGSIYSLYRRGSLLSDDEVILMFNPFDGKPVSLALVNVRYALSMLVKQGILTRREALELADSGVGIFFADRRWAPIFKGTSVESRLPELEPLLDGFDLKKMDALRSLRAVRAWLADEKNVFPGPSPDIQMLVPSEISRERDLQQSSWIKRLRDKKEFALWLIASGRYRRMKFNSESDRISLENDFGLQQGEWLERLMSCPGQEDELMKSMMRFAAIESALEMSRDRVVKTVYLEQARKEIALAHGSEDWAGLQAQLAGKPVLRQLVNDYQKPLATARQAREEAFAS